MVDDSVIDRSDVAAATSEARLSSVFNTAVDGIIVMNAKCQILVFNQACEKLFGFTAEELIGENVKRIMPMDYAVAHDRFVQNYLETGNKKIIGIGREVKGQHKDGTIIPVELSVGEATTPEGRQFIGILRDLRPRKQIEDRLMKAQAQLVHMTRLSALDEMGAAIAHELNQPLTAILLYMQSVSRKASADGSIPEPVLEVIAKAVKEAERASDIIQRMRQLVERKAPERTCINVTELVDTCLEMAELGSADNETVLASDVPDGLPPLMADPVQIRQILINLLRNAREAISGQPVRKVVLSVRLEENVLEFRVQDSGPGVPDEIAEGLFRAFSGTKHKGVGLGLAISRSIAQNHGGDLKLERTKKGHGASFLLTLPVVAEQFAG